MSKQEVVHYDDEEDVDYEPSEQEEDKHGLDNGFYHRKNKSNDPQRDQMIETTYDTDAWQKRLTGRTPEDIKEETGFAKEEIFPEGQKILYVGDPWQKMGREIDDPNLTIIDYEYGEAISFISDKEHFLQDIADRGDRLISDIKIIQQHHDLNQNESEWLLSFREMVLAANRVSEATQELADYPEAARTWQEAKEFIENSQGEKDPLSKSGLIHFRRDAWYICIYGERGFRDIPDWETIIKLKLEADKKKMNEQKLDPEEVSRQLKLKRKQYIEEVRLKKKPEKAGVVEGIFPELPFKDESFDRFIASWSISTHVFSELNREGFSVYWDEINRVLKSGGRAYIFPLYEMDETDFRNSLEAAHRLKIPVVKREIYWQKLMRCGTGIAVAGTHGKTTTTAMIGYILQEAGFDPTVMVGGFVPQFGGTVRLGKLDYVVVEADEYDRAFLKTTSKISVITNIDPDHFDTYPGGLPEIRQAFKKFIRLLPKTEGILVAYGKDPNIRQIAKSFDLKYRFYDENHLWPGLKLKIPGAHNLLNATAAARVAHELGVDHRTIKHALNHFQGVGRRQEYLGKVGKGMIFDDYAHHPREITATIEAIRDLHPNKKFLVVFQPHQKRRTKELLADFAESLKSADSTLIAPLFYVAGREDDLDISSKDIATAANSPKVQAFNDWPKFWSTFEKTLPDFDICLIMGAGDLSQKARERLKIEK